MESNLYKKLTMITSNLSCIKFLVRWISCIMSSCDFGDNLKLANSGKCSPMDLPLRIFSSIMSCLLRNTITPALHKYRLCQTSPKTRKASFNRFTLGSSRNVWSKSPHDIINSIAWIPSNTWIHLDRWSRWPPTSNIRISWFPPPSFRDTGT